MANSYYEERRKARNSRFHQPPRRNCNSNATITGTPEDVVKVERSYTGKLLAPVLRRREQKGKKRVVAAE